MPLICTLARRIQIGNIRTVQQVECLELFISIWGLAVWIQNRTSFSLRTSGLQPVFLPHFLHALLLTWCELILTRVVCIVHIVVDWVLTGEGWREVTILYWSQLIL
jgi:hypothetical protein